ncbi:hypothetical protein BH11BAC1_BH11BAC1_27540 [soil metagenome]
MIAFANQPDHKMKIHLIAFMLTLADFASADQWMQKTDFIGTRSRGVAFAINQKGYVGTGLSYLGLFKDFWCYDPVNDTWTQVADLPGAERMDAFGFELGGKGYVGCGNEDAAYERDFWEFNPITNSWIQKADFPDVRFSAVSFSIGSYGYAGTGISGWGALRNDFWEYNPTSDAWTRKADFIGSGRWHAVGFSINGKGYIGTGTDTSSNNVQDFYEYDPLNDSWVSKADYSGGPLTRATGFVIGNLGYVGLGFGNTTLNREVWQFNQVLNTWTQKSDFSGSWRSSTMTFTMNNRAYVCAGDSVVYGAGTIQGRTLWEYTPDSLDAINELTFSEAGLEIFPNPVHEYITIHSKHPVILSIYTEEGKVLIKNMMCENSLRLDAQNWAAGIYYLKVEMNNRSLVHSLVKE